MIVIGLMLLFIWLGFLIPQYFAWKNKRYKAIWVCLSVFAVSVAACVALVVYGDFITSLLNCSPTAQSKSANEFILCVLGVVWVVSHFFCWWYIYKRRSWDYIYLNGYTADDLQKILSPESLKLLEL